MEASNASFNQADKVVEAQRSILFLDKVLLQSRSGSAIRGVELFNISLIKELLALGYLVTLPAASDWRDEIKSRIDSPNLSVFYLPGSFGTVLNSLLAAAPMVFKHFEILFIANVGKGLVPSVRLLNFSRSFSRSVLLAHREATPSFVSALKKCRMDVISVNQQIAKPFREAGYPIAEVYYGIMNHQLFYPEAKGEKAFFDFVLLGQLANAWKGADTAIEAFMLLPDQVRAKCRLHLASFSKNAPKTPDKNIIIYNWLAIDEVPSFLRQMDAMLVPSRDEHVMRETFSQAIVQGMLTGLPILANDLPILTEKLDSGGGLIFSSPQQLAQQMQTLAEDSDLCQRLAEQGRRTALERYCWSTKKFAELYL